MTGPKTRVLFVGIAMSGSSVTRVLSAIAANLPEQYEIYFFGTCRQVSRRIDIPGVCFYPWPDSFQNPCAVNYLQSLLWEIKPRLVFFMGQPWWYTELLQALNQSPREFRIIIYMPIEGYLEDLEYAQYLGLVDHCIVYTRFAHDNLSELAPKLANTAPGFKMPQLHILPHGVDTQNFYPIIEKAGDSSLSENRKLMRARLLPDRPEFLEAMIVLNANQAYLRKRIDLTIQSFALFLQERPSANAYLFLHQNDLQPYHLKQIKAWSNEAGIAERVLLNPFSAEGESISEQRLNELYNICDIGINTAMGEGWGLISFEHAATGATQLVPNHTTFKENWESAGIMLNINSQAYLDQEHTQVYIVAPEAAAAELVKLYDQAEYRRQMSDLAYQRALLPKFQWPNIADQLQQIFGLILTEGV